MPSPYDDLIPEPTSAYEDLVPEKKADFGGKLGLSMPQVDTTPEFNADLPNPQEYRTASTFLPEVNPIKVAGEEAQQLAQSQATVNRINSFYEPLKERSANDPEKFQLAEEARKQALRDAGVGVVESWDNPHLPRVSSQEFETALGMSPGVAKVASGLQKGAAGALDFFLTPEGTLMLGAGDLPEGLRRGFSAMFAADMAAKTPGLIKELAQAWNKGDTERAVELGVNAGLNVLFAKGALDHARTPEEYHQIQKWLKESENTSTVDIARQQALESSSPFHVGNEVNAEQHITGNEPLNRTGWVPPVATEDRGAGLGSAPTGETAARGTPEPAAPAQEPKYGGFGTFLTGRQTPPEQEPTLEEQRARATAGPLNRGRMSEALGIPTQEKYDIAQERNLPSGQRAQEEGQATQPGEVSQQGAGGEQTPASRVVQASPEGLKPNYLRTERRLPVQTELAVPPAERGRTLEPAPPIPPEPIPIEPSGRNPLEGPLSTGQMRNRLRAYNNVAPERPSGLYTGKPSGLRVPLEAQKKSVVEAEQPPPRPPIVEKPYELQHPNLRSVGDAYSMARLHSEHWPALSCMNPVVSAAGLTMRSMLPPTHLESDNRHSSSGHRCSESDHHGFRLRLF